jgi:hypothetical protein
MKTRTVYYTLGAIVLLGVALWFGYHSHIVRIE